MKAALICFPGTNRERDLAAAFMRATGRKPDIIWHKDTDFSQKYDLILLPGGFSYGDYLRPGAIAAQSPIMGAVKKAADQGVYILGICNGFQILTEVGLLPGALLRNRALKFVSRPVDMIVEQNSRPFLHHYQAGQQVTFPVAHHDGNYTADPDILHELEQSGRIALRYIDIALKESTRGNPNGSAANIAGILNKTGNVMGLMPHPENAVDPSASGTTGDGFPLFTAFA